MTLKPVPHLAFKAEGSVGVQPNQLILTVQPNEGVSLSLGAKIPGSRMRIRPVNMEFLYGTSFLSQSPEAYERLIMDAMRGDPRSSPATTRSRRSGGSSTRSSRRGRRTRTPLAEYPAGSHGPEEADRILAPGHRWRGV